MDPPWRPLPPIRRPQRDPVRRQPPVPPAPLTSRQRLKRLCSCRAWRRRLMLDQCSLRSRSDCLIVCAVIQIVLGIATLILTSVKVIICGTDTVDIIWTYGFSGVMLCSGILAAVFLKRKIDSKVFAMVLFVASLLVVSTTSASFVYITEDFNGFQNPDTSQKDFFCHDGKSWVAYINIHFRTMYFVEVGGILTAIVQGIAALSMVVKFRRCCRRSRRSHVTEDRRDEGEQTNADEGGETESENELESASGSHDETDSITMTPLLEVRQDNMTAGDQHHPPGYSLVDDANVDEYAIREDLNGDDVGRNIGDDEQDADGCRQPNGEMGGVSNNSEHDVRLLSDNDLQQEVSCGEDVPLIGVRD